MNLYFEILHWFVYTWASQKVTSLSHVQKYEMARIFMPCLNTCIRPHSKIALISSHSLIRYMSNMASTEKAGFFCLKLSTVL